MVLHTGMAELVRRAGLAQHSPTVGIVEESHQSPQLLTAQGQPDPADRIGSPRPGQHAHASDGEPEGCPVGRPKDRMRPGIGRIEHEATDDGAGKREHAATHAPIHAVTQDPTRDPAHNRARQYRHDATNDAERASRGESDHETPREAERQRQDYAE